MDHQIEIGGVALNWAELHELKRRREEEGAGLADMCEAMGAPRDDWRQLQAAIERLPDTPPAESEMSAIERLEQQALRQMAEGPALVGGMQEAIRNAGKDKPLTDDELRRVERIYATAATISFEEIGAALVPPRQALTVATAIAEAGWVRPGFKLNPALALDRMASQDPNEFSKVLAEQNAKRALSAVNTSAVAAAPVFVPVAGTRPETTGSEREAGLAGPDAIAERVQQQQERDEAAMNAAEALGA